MDINYAYVCYCSNYESIWTLKCVIQISKFIFQLFKHVFQFWDILFESKNQYFHSENYISILKKLFEF